MNGLGPALLCTCYPIVTSDYYTAIVFIIRYVYHLKKSLSYRHLIILCTYIHAYKYLLTIAVIIS